MGKIFLLATFLAFFGLNPLTAWGGPKHLGQEGLESYKLPNRPIRKDWNPHAMVESLLERLAPEKEDAWGVHPPDGFDIKLNSIRWRLNNLMRDFNEAELAALESEALRTAKAQEIILNRITALKEEANTSATPKQRENMDKLIEVLQTRHKEAINIHAQVSKFMDHKKQESFQTN